MGMRSYGWPEPGNTQGYPGVGEESGKADGANLQRGLEIEYGLCSRSLTSVLAFNPHATLELSFFRWNNRSPERWSNLPKDTQSVVGLKFIPAASGQRTDVLANVWAPFVGQARVFTHPPGWSDRTMNQKVGAPRIFLKNMMPARSVARGCADIHIWFKSVCACFNW